MSSTKPDNGHDVESAKIASVFCPGTTKVALVDGSTKVVPKLTWRKEIKILESLGNVIVGVWSLSSLSLSDIKASNKEQVEKLGQIIATTMPEEVTTVAAILLEAEADWIKDNMDIEGLMGLIVPFFVYKQMRIKERIQPYMELVAEEQLKQVRKMKELADVTT